MAFRQYLFNKFQPAIPALISGQSSPQPIDSTGALCVNPEGRRATFSAHGTSVLAAGGSAQPSLSIQGSNSKVIRITRAYFSVTAATGAAVIFFLCRFSMISGGTFTQPAAIPFDELNPPSQAGIASWTAAATSLTGSIRFASSQYEIVTAAVSVLPQVIDWPFGNNSSQPLVVRGTSDFIGMGVSGIGTTPTADLWFEWTEE